MPSPIALRSAALVEKVLVLLDPEPAKVKVAILMQALGEAIADAPMSVEAKHKMIAISVSVLTANVNDEDYQPGKATS